MCCLYSFICGINQCFVVSYWQYCLQVRKDEQWRRAMEYVSMVSELNYMSQIVIMLYEDPTKDPCSEER